MTSKNGWLRDYSNVLQFVFNGEIFVLEKASSVLKVLPTYTVQNVHDIAKALKIPHYRVGDGTDERYWFDVREVFDFAKVVPKGAEQKEWASRVPGEKLMFDRQRIKIEADLIRLDEDSFTLSNTESDDVVRFDYDDDTYSLEIANKIADYLSVSAGWVRNKAHNKLIAHYRIGTRVYFDKRDVADYSRCLVSGSTPWPVREPGAKTVHIAEKYRTEIEIIRYAARPHSFRMPKAHNLELVKVRQ